MNDEAFNWDDSILSLEHNADVLAQSALSALDVHIQNHRQGLVKSPAPLPPYAKIVDHKNFVWQNMPPRLYVGVSLERYFSGNHNLASDIYVHLINTLGSLGKPSGRNEFLVSENFDRIPSGLYLFAGYNTIFRAH